MAVNRDTAAVTIMVGGAIVIIVILFLLATSNSEVPPVTNDSLTGDCPPEKTAEEGTYGKLTLGGNQWCRIKPGGTNEFIYYGKSQQSVRISASAWKGELDLKLEIKKYGGPSYEPGKSLRSDDNSGLNLDPLIEDLKLPETIQYIVSVTAWGELDDSKDPKQYSISLVRAEGPLYSSWIAALLIGIFGSVGLGSLITVIYIVFIRRRKSRATKELTFPDQEVAENQDGEDAVQLSATGPILTKLQHLEQLLEKEKDSDEALSIVRNQRDSMEALMNEYKTGYNFLVLQDALTGIIDAYEYAKDTQTEVSSSQDINKETIEKYIGTIEGTLEQCLGDAGVESFTPNKGDSYREAYGVENVGTVPTDDHALIGTIAEVKSVGYTSILPENRLDKKIVRKARVTIFIDENIQ